MLLPLFGVCVTLKVSSAGDDFEFPISSFGFLGLVVVAPVTDVLVFFWYVVGTFFLG